jgi:hypothetical protein
MAESKKKTPSKKAAAPSAVIFESREKEPSQFAVAGVRPIRNFANGRLEYKVPSSDVDRFEQNHFVMNGRIVRQG